MRLRYKIVRVIVLAVLVALIPASVVLAAISSPDTIQINQVNVYRNCIETNDQLYLIVYTLEYTTAPSDDISDTFLCRLLDTDGVTQLRAVAPYPYNNDGYDYGVISIYFDSTDAPTWNQAYTVELTGNPSLDWGGDPSSTKTTSFASWYDDTTITSTQIQLAARLRYLANKIGNDWGLDLIDTSTGKLEDAGESYFGNVIENLRLMCPDLYSEVVSPIEVEERTYANTQGATYEARLIGTWLDMTGFAADWGLTHLWVTSVIWMILSFGIATLFTKLGNDFRPTFYIIGIMTMVGAFLGFLNFTCIGIMGLIAAVGLAYIYGLRGTGA